MCVCVREGGREGGREEGGMEQESVVKPSKESRHSVQLANKNISSCFSKVENQTTTQDKEERANYHTWDGLSVRVLLPCFDDPNFRIDFKAVLYK